jgi:hypothetical protein
MNLSSIKYVELICWKEDDSIPTIFQREIRKELVKRKSVIAKLPVKDRIKLAAQIIISGPALGGETIDDVFISLRLVNLQRTKDMVNAVYQKAFGEKDIYQSLSPSCQRSIRK